MVKEVLLFTEMAYSVYPREEAQRLGFTNLMFSNRFFDPQQAASLYRMYFDEYQYATETGFDGVMTNEHHDAPFCMQACTDIIAAGLVQVVKRGRIALLGNPLPIHDNPVRVAEEVAMLDLLSGGRIISGFIRGTGVESIASNYNPAYNRERFQEAHDLVVKTWTTPGPFRWEGKHFQIRVVNPWVLPLQKPHPPIWIPGVSSPETIIWAAQHGYPYIALGTDLEATIRIRKLYETTAREAGFSMTPDHFGYVIRCNVQDTDENAYEVGKHFQWQRGSFTGVGAPHWAAPPGYSSRVKNPPAASLATRQAQDYDAQVKSLGMVVGNPNTAIRNLKTMLDRTHPSWIIFWTREGTMPHDQAMRSLELLGREVIPAIKEYRPQFEG